MGFVFSGMTGGVLLSPFLAGMVYARAGYFPVFAMVIAALLADLLLRAAMIEKRSAAQWDASGRSSDHDAGGSPQVSNRARSQAEATKAGHFAGDGREQAGQCPDLEPGAHSPLLQTSLGQNIDPHADCKPISQPPAGSQSSKAWCMRYFPSITTMIGSKRLMTAVFGIFVHTTIATSFDGVLAQFVKRTFDFDFSGVGLIFLAVTTPALFGAGFGALSDRYGPRKVALAGNATAALGLGLTVLISHKSKAQIVGLSIVLVLTGLGIQLILTPLSADMSYEADILAEENPDVFGEAGSHAKVYSLLCAAFGLATAVGPAWTGFLYEETSWGITMLTLVLLCLLGSIPVFLYTGGRQSKAIALEEDCQT
ncbi:MAG: hypothetical protein Q9199_004581 [Rusavskia elegans]